jgi:site-specific DNA-methyltransferase (adenine-specific)
MLKSKGELPIDTIVHGDCIEVMKQWPDECIDLVVTDPPYGFNRFPSDKKETFMQIIRDAFIEIRRVLKKGKWAFVFSGTGQLKNLFSAVDLDFQRLLTVYKPADCTFPYRGWLLTSEAIALFSKGNPKPLFDRHPYQHDCYVHKRVGKEGVEGHPTVKPLWVVKDLVNRSFEGDLICDPFVGSGTTCVAAKNLKRHYIGIEKELEYYNIAIKRVNDPQLNLL